MTAFRAATLLTLALIATAPLPAASQTTAAPATPAPKAPPALSVEDAVKRTEAGDFKEAIRILEALRKDSKLNGPGVSLLGTLYVDTRRPAEALALLAPLADDAGAEAAVLYNAGRAAAGVGRVEQAQGYFERSVAKSSATPAARELGLLYSRQGKAVESYRLLRPWVLTNPQDAEARLTAAAVALRLERVAEAENFLVGHQGQDPAVDLLRGEILAAKGDGKGALAVLQPLAAHHPPGMDSEVDRALAQAHLASGDPSSAARILTGKTRGIPSLVLLLGRAQRLAGNVPAAIATLRPLAEKLPASASTVSDPRPASGIALEYGRAILVSAGPAAAIPFFQKATQLNPLNREAWESLAQALDQSGRKAEADAARAQLERLPKRAPGATS